MFQKSVLTKKIVVLSKLFCFRIEKNSGTFQCTFPFIVYIFFNYFSSVVSVASEQWFDVIPRYLIPISHSSLKLAWSLRGMTGCSNVPSRLINFWCNSALIYPLFHFISLHSQNKQTFCLHIALSFFLSQHTQHKYIFIIHSIQRKYSLSHKSPSSTNTFYARLSHIYFISHTKHTQ